VWACGLRFCCPCPMCAVSGCHPPVCPGVSRTRSLVGSGAAQSAATRVLMRLLAHVQLEVAAGREKRPLHCADHLLRVGGRISALNLLLCFVFFLSRLTFRACRCVLGHGRDGGGLPHAHAAVPNWLPDASFVLEPSHPAGGRCVYVHGASPSPAPPDARFSARTTAPSSRLLSKAAFLPHRRSQSAGSRSALPSVRSTLPCRFHPAVSHLPLNLMFSGIHVWHGGARGAGRVGGGP
jgi:hypothetical protein